MEEEDDEDEYDLNNSSKRPRLSEASARPLSVLRRDFPGTWKSSGLGFVRRRREESRGKRRRRNQMANSTN